MNYLAKTVSGMQELLAICPCCGDIFRLVEAKFTFPKSASRTCDYLEMVKLEDRVNRTEELLSGAEDRFDERLENQREKYVQAGRRRAKRKLKKIDPTFSGRNIDPQDVKVIFDPVEYIIFHGLSSDDGVQFIELVSRKPASRAEEKLTGSIDRVIKNGDIEFETLHMTDTGAFEIRKA